MSATAITLQESAPPNQRGRLLFAEVAGYLPLFGILVAVFATYYSTLDDYFHGDDYIAFIDLATKTPGHFLRDALLAQDTNIYWRPLGQIYYQVVFELFGINEVAFHAANVYLFLVSLVFLYAFCRRLGLDRMVSLGAVAWFGLFPNHAISVAWVTNGPRVLAVLFALGGLLLMQEALRRRSFGFELLAFVATVLATLSDETALALVPLPVLYGLIFDHRMPGWPLRTVRRAAPYLILLATFAPIQLSENWQDVGGEYSAGVGWHIPEHLWALGAKLVLPVKDGVSFSEIDTSQWVGGAVAAVIGGWLLLFGSDRVRLLIIWTLLGLAPFALWITPIAPARYVYMAAVPYSILMSWLIVSLARGVVRLSLWRFQPRAFAAVGVLAASAAVALSGGLFASMTMARNEAFARETESYRILAEELPKAVPTVPPGGRVVIYYGIWTGLRIWPESVVRTVYKDPTIRVVNVPGREVDSSRPPSQVRDVVVYYTSIGFIPFSPNLAQRTSGQ